MLIVLSACGQRETLSRGSLRKGSRCDQSTGWLLGGQRLSRQLVHRASSRIGSAQCLRCQIRQVEHCRLAKALREALRPRRSHTTPPRPRGLHPGGALARTHRNKTQPREAGPLAKKCDDSLQASANTPFEARGLLSGTIIRGTLKAPNSQLVTPISIKLQRPDAVSYTHLKCAHLARLHAACMAARPFARWSGQKWRAACNRWAVARTAHGGLASSALSRLA